MMANITGWDKFRSALGFGFSKKTETALAKEAQEFVETLRKQTEARIAEAARKAEEAKAEADKIAKATAKIDKVKAAAKPQTGAKPAAKPAAKKPATPKATAPAKKAIPKKPSK